MLSRIVLNSSDKSENHIVISLTDKGLFGDSLIQAGVTLYCIGFSPSRLSLKGLLMMFNIIRKEKPNVVMTWLYHSDFLGFIISVLAGVRRKNIVWNLRCSDIDFSKYARSTFLVSKLLAFLSPFVGKIAFNSYEGCSQHKKLGYRSRNWIYLPNGLDVSVWCPNKTSRRSVRHLLGVDEDEFLIGIVARADPQKDHDNFFNAAVVVSEASNLRVRFLLVGHGTESISIPEEIRGKILLLGPRNDIPDILRALDLHVLSSAYGEGFPNAVCEAMATAVPCIATDVGDTRLLIGDPNLVARRKDSADLACKILKFMNLSVSERKKCGDQARLRIQSNYSIEKSLENYQSIWK